jgi:hypothetical protein
MPRKGTRSIVVDGVHYRWRVRYDPWYWTERSAFWHDAPVRLSVAAAGNVGPCLVAEFVAGRSSPVEALRSPFTPGLVRTLILAGLAKGWEPCRSSSRPVRLGHVEVAAAAAAPR